MCNIAHVAFFHGSSSKVKVLPHDLAIPLLEVYPKELKIYIHIKTST